MSRGVLHTAGDVIAALTLSDTEVSIFMVPGSGAFDEENVPPIHPGREALWNVVAARRNQSAMQCEAAVALRDIVAYGERAGVGSANIDWCLQVAGNLLYGFAIGLGTRVRVGDVESIGVGFVACRLDVKVRRLGDIVAGHDGTIGLHFQKQLVIVARNYIGTIYRVTHNCSKPYNISTI